MNEHIFRSYDIRGIYGKDLTDEAAEKIGTAIANYLNCDIAIARDMRNSSEAVMKKVADGILNAGCNVYSLDLLPFGPGMFYAWQNKMAFIHITASHLSKEWGGIKMFHSSGTSLTDKEIIKVRDGVINFRQKNAEKGTLKRIDGSGILSDYKNYLVSRLRPEKKMPVVIDCGNGMAGMVARELFTAAGFDVAIMFEELDGNFPNRSSEPTVDSLKELSKRVDGRIGIAYDGDGDRAVFVDENGRVVKSEQLGSLMAAELAKTEKGPIIATMECTRGIDVVAKKLSRLVKRIRVGHPYLVSESMHTKAIIGMEDSGHFIIPSLLPFGDAIAVSLYAACMLSRSNRKLADMVNELPDFPSLRRKFRSSDASKFMVVENLKNALAKTYKDVNTTDGVRVDTPDGWALIRPSNTEPIIRMTIEAQDEKALAKLEKEFSALLEAELKKFGD